MPPLYARPRHAAPRNHAKVKAALVPAVLVASTGSALGGLAVSASAQTTPTAVTAAATSPTAEQTLLAVDVEAAARELALQRDAARASRDRARGEAKAAELAAAAEAARLAEEARKAEEARVAEEARKAAEAARLAEANKTVRPATGRLTSSYGPRWGRMHRGLDIAAGSGAPIYAAAAGTVVSAGWEGGYGRAVRIEHPDGSQTLYAHNSSLLVRRGQRVAAGQQIAREGATGNVTGIHLHFEVRVNGEYVNPRDWLRRRGAQL